MVFFVCVVKMMPISTLITTNMINNPIFISKAPVELRYFFKVRETPVLFTDPQNHQLMCYYKDRKVIVNLSTNNGISIVRDNFLLVEHKDAYELGVAIFERLFGVTPQVHKEFLNQNTTDYVVDLISEDTTFILDGNGFQYESIRRDDSYNYLAEPPYTRRDFSASNSLVGAPWIVPKFQDKYRPFIRVSNYLRDNNSLHIELGFYRDRCTNGMLLGQRSRSIFKQSYFVPHFEIIKRNAFEYFENHNQKMYGSMERLWKLLSMPVSRENMRLIAFDIYGEELRKKGIEEREYLQHLISDLVNAYTDEIGENMNAALNVATDLSKRLETGRGSQSNLQRRASMWMQRVTSRSFRIEKYLYDLQDVEESVMNAKSQKEEEFIDDEF
jgi:cell division protein ZapA (FtsZ GTPase activity inhibitor)